MWILSDELCKQDVDMEYGYPTADMNILLHGGEIATATHINPLFKVGETLKSTTATIPLNSLYEELRYLFPFLGTYRRQMLECGFGEGAALATAINKFLENFSLRYIFIPTFRVKYAGVDGLGGSDETCYYALSPKERASFLIAYDADDDESAKSGVYLEFVAQTYPNSGKPYLMTKLRFGIQKYSYFNDICPGFPSDSRFLKGSVMPIRPLVEFFNRVLGVKNSMSNAFKDTLGDEIDVAAALYISVLGDEDRGHYADERGYYADRNLLVKGANSDATHYNENVKFAGTQADVDDLNKVLSELGIGGLPLGRVDCSIIPDDLWEQAESDSAMRQIMSMGGTDDKYYGCLMPVAWVMSQGVYDFSWHMVACMKDWRAFVGTDNFAPVLNKLTVFGAATTEYATVLVTSAGFLNVTNGTLENPFEVSRLSLDDMVSMCGAGASREDFDEVFAECLELGEGPRVSTGSLKAGTVDFLLGRVRILATLYDKNKSLTDYNRRWWYREYMDGDVNKTTSFGKVVFGITPKILVGTPYTFAVANKEDLDEKKPLGETEIALFRLVTVIDALAYSLKICTRQYGKDNVGVSFDDISESSQAMSICKVPLRA